MIDAAELTHIWDAHSERLLLIARSVGGPAEDAVQEAFMALARQPALPDDPLAWLVKVTRNRLLQWQRSSQRRRQREETVGNQPWFRCDPDERLDANEVTAALIALPSPQREVIVMHLWGEMSFETIAEVIETSRATAHRAFHSGLATLQHKFHCQPETDPIQATR